MFSLWSSLLKEQLREMTYMAEMAYLASSVSAGECSLDISIGGFNDSLAEYTERLFKIIAAFECVNRSEFNMQHEKLMRGY